MIRTTDRWRHPPRGTPEQAIATFRSWGSFPIGDVEDAVREMYRLGALVTLDAALLVAHAALETGDRSRGRGFLDKNWATVDRYRDPKNRYNISGMGITDTNDLGYRWANGVDAARAHVVHHARYEIPADDPAWDHLRPYIHLDKRFDAVPAANRGTVRTVADLTGKWWTNRDGHINLASRGNQIFPNLPDQGATPDPQPGDNGGNDMATYKTAIPGLPGGPLETSFPVKLMIVPSWRTNNRPGIKARTPRLSVQHETANSGTYAAAEATYLYNGAGGRQASWHFTVDDREGYVSIPVDEVAWQAGDGSGPGNYNGVACELAVHRDIVNSATRRAQSQKNAAELMGKVGARLNATPPARQHANFMNKNCPAQMRNRGEWNRYVDWWHHFYQMEKAAMQGKPAPEPVVYYIGDTIKALVPLNLRQRAGTGNVPVIATLPVGTEAVINGPFEWKDNYGWLPVETSYGNGFVAMGENGVLWIEKVKDRPAPQPEPEPEPEPEPQYVPARPIPALLETDLKKYDTAEGITTDDLGQDFIFVADVIEFTKDTVAAQFAVKNPKPVKAPYHAGDRAIAAWLVKSQDTDSWWYVLAGGDDEWVRVPYANTKRVSDAPLLPGQEWGESEEADVSDVINALKDVLDDSAQ